MNTTFLKWAGGKNWFVHQESYRFPTHYNRYIDPFLGGGAVFFFLEPEAAVLSDVNEELINTYIGIRDNWQEVENCLQEHAQHHSDAYYYQVRNQRPLGNAEIAARMIYLNRTCFNGIYRVNRQGVFNVPRGSKNNVMLQQDLFEERSILLNGKEIVCRDFERTIDMADEDDFLFCDPPYAVQEGQSFVGYTGNLFSWDDQVRLAGALERARQRNVKILMTNVDHPSVRALYEGMDGFTLDVVARYTSISGRNGGRRQYQELIVTSNM